MNPGAIDVLDTNDGGTPTWGDEDCDGMPGDSAMPCDTGLALTDVSPTDAAKAIELCVQATSASRKYGVISATYLRADGTAYTRNFRAAPDGDRVRVRDERAHAGRRQHVDPLHRVRADTGQALLTASCTTNDAGAPPTGFPQDDPACPPTKLVADDVTLEVR